jgi:pimeloyl-ACP methyl ester carboxylesterase
MTPTFESWRDGGRRFSHRGHPIFWQTGGSGEGPSLLCVHGFPSASWDWHALWPVLCRSFGRVIAADMIGFGWSAKPGRYRYSIFDQADLQENLLRSQGVSRYHLLAHDYGVSVAQELLARHQERRAAGDGSLELQSVCLLNGGLFPESHRPLLLQKLLLTPLGPVLAALTNRRAFARSFSKVFGHSTRPNAAELDQFWELFAHGGGRRIAHKLIHYIPERRANRSRWVGALQTAGVPLRLINGPADPVSGAHLVERYRELVPDPDTVMLPGIGHYPQLEDAEGTWQAFLAFHRRVAATSTGGVL